MIVEGTSDLIQYIEFNSLHFYSVFQEHAYSISRLIHMDDINMP
jgi:hypothetical protein